MKDKWIYKNKWMTFYFDWNFNISFEKYGYSDTKPRLNLGLIFFNLTIKLPFKSKCEETWGESPRYGIAIHHNKIWIFYGNDKNTDGSRWYTITLPWDYTWVSTSILCKDNHWETETNKDRKNFYEDKWNDIKFTETVPYKYTLKNGETQERMATISVEKREWRWYWFKWLSLTKKTYTNINVDFEHAIGENCDSWKGGTYGCSYKLLKNETPLQCLRRMEKERRF